MSRESRKEEAILRNEGAGFDDHVGSFWYVLETRPYMCVKYELLRTLSVLATHDSMTSALAESMDSLRLSRSDNLGVRGGILVMMLSLGKLQEFYDFIKWWATNDPDGHYNYYDTSVPYLSIVGANMFEPVTALADKDSVFS